jgi:tripartite-type tricarboxylate transporter receptor subunit TctC
VIVENVGGAGGSIGVSRLARATPDGYTTDIGQWDTPQVGGLLLQKLTGTEVLFVPYRGAGPAMTDLISGYVWLR